MTKDSSSTSTIRACLVVPFFPPTYSGAGQQVYDYGQHLPAQGVEVRIVAANLAGAASREWMANMLVERFAPPLGQRLMHLFFIFQLNWLLWRRRKEIDLVHFNGAYFPLLAAIPLMRLLGKKTVLTFHDPEGDMPEIIAQRPFGSLQVRIVNSNDKLVHHTTFIANSYLRLGLPRENLRQIMCGIDVADRFMPVTAERKAELRALRALPAGAKIAVFTGAVVQRKGVDVLVEAWRAVVDRCPEALLLLVGPLDMLEDPAHTGYVDALHRRIDDLGLQDSVQFTGRTDEPEDYLQLADIFVFPSRQETFGLSQIEAMACGLPCVVANIEGVTTDIFEHGVDGLLVGQDDPEGFSRAVISLLGDEALARRLGQQAMAKVDQQFTVQIISRKYSALYRELLDK